jgi:hypothetical protein
LQDALHRLVQTVDAGGEHPLQCFWDFRQLHPARDAPGAERASPLVVGENSSARCSQAAALAVNIVLTTLGLCPTH